MADMGPELHKVFCALEKYQEDCWKNVRYERQWAPIAVELIAQIEDVYNEYFKQHERQPRQPR